MLCCDASSRNLIPTFVVEGLMNNVPEVDSSKSIRPAKQPAVPMAVAFVLFVLAGAPLAFFAWKTLSDLLAGRVEGASTLIGLGALVLFLVVLRLLGGYLKQL
jgi:hypothetical protein